MSDPCDDRQVGQGFRCGSIQSTDERALTQSRTRRPASFRWQRVHRWSVRPRAALEMTTSSAVLSSAAARDATRWHRVRSIARPRESRGRTHRTSRTSDRVCPDHPEATCRMSSRSNESRWSAHATWPAILPHSPTLVWGGRLNTEERPVNTDRARTPKVKTRRPGEVVRLPHTSVGLVSHRTIGEPCHHGHSRPYCSVVPSLTTASFFSFATSFSSSRFGLPNQSSDQIRWMFHPSRSRISCRRRSRSRAALAE